MTLEIPSAIRLEEAYFCLNCELVTNCSDTCLACGDRQLWSLENWLGRVNGYENGGEEEGILTGNKKLPIRDFDLGPGGNVAPGNFSAPGSTNAIEERRAKEAFPAQANEFVWLLQ